jgi:uncharacterized membrane protein YqjE
MALGAPVEGPSARKSRSASPAAAPTSLRSGVRAVLAHAETRARIAASEVEEQVLRLLEVAAWAAVALLLFAIGLVFLAFFVVLLFWDTNRLLAAGLVTVVFISGGALGVLMVRAGLAARPQFLSATIAEFQKDRARAQKRDAQP